MSLVPKNWGEFQHYKDRAPIWIKLHRTLLDDYEFQMLPVASRALAPMLWLLASEYDGGKITASLDAIAFRLRLPRAELCESLHPLIEAKFFFFDNDIDGCSRDASAVLAGGNQNSIPEKERETERQDKTEGTSPSSVAIAPDGDGAEEILRASKSPIMARALAQAVSLAVAPKSFDDFWTSYPKRDGPNPKVAARKKFVAALKSGVSPQQIIESTKAYADEMRRAGKVGTPYIPHAVTWLGQQRWADYEQTADDVERRAKIDRDMAALGYVWTGEKWEQQHEVA